MCKSLSDRTRMFMDRSSSRWIIKASPLQMSTAGIFPNREGFGDLILQKQFFETSRILIEPILRTLVPPPPFLDVSFKILLPAFPQKLFSKSRRGRRFRMEPVPRSLVPPPIFLGAAIQVLLPTILQELIFEEYLFCGGMPEGHHSAKSLRADNGCPSHAVNGRVPRRRCLSEGC